MASTLAHFDFTAPSILSDDRRRYPWKDWFDGQIWQLFPEDDFSDNPLMMERVIRGTAVRKKYSVQIRHQPDGSIVLKATKK